MLTKQAILDANDLPTEVVDVPEWGDSITIRTLTGAERDEFENAIASARKGSGIDITGVKARLVILTALDENGERMFEMSDLPALQGKSASALDRIFQVAQKLSGLRQDDVEELVGN